MNIRKIKKAMRSDNPANSLYSLIPENQRKQFAEFAKSFGVSEEMIREQVKYSLFLLKPKGEGVSKQACPLLCWKQGLMLRLGSCVVQNVSDGLDTQARSFLYLVIDVRFWYKVRIFAQFLQHIVIDFVYIVPPYNSAISSIFT